MREGVTNGGAPIPSQIADKLRGQSFETFKKFREAFWMEVAKDPELSKQFIARNQANMKNGNAPFVPKSERVGGKIKFELDHIDPIAKGGSVYDVDNIQIMTPKAHIAKTSAESSK